MYYDNDHIKKIESFNQGWNNLTDVEKLARSYGIDDIAMDNNLKLLQTLILFDMTNQPEREGPDAFDEYGNAWELKTINLSSSASGFSTNHHTTYERIEVFRQERWLFSIYRGIILEECYAVSPRALEPYFTKWENKLKENNSSHINNPKIPVQFVRQVGIQVYPVDASNPLSPADALRYIDY